MTLLVSACLLGCPCRYDGASRPDARVLALMAKHTLIPVCPEVLGGLPTPRPPAERREGRVLCADGKDVTDAYLRGARETLRLSALYHVDGAIFKERSPSCGCRYIYDGTHGRHLIPGMGVTAELFTAAGVSVFSEEELDLLALS